MNYTLFPRRQSEEILKCTFHCRLVVMQVQSCAKNSQLLRVLKFHIFYVRWCLFVFFFAVIVNGTLCGSCFKSSIICLFVCLFISAGSEMQICLRFLLEIIMMDVCGMITSQYVFYVRYRFQNNLLLVSVQ